MIQSDVALIGRQREEALLWRQFGVVAEGQLSVTLVTGEPGIGKTALLNRIAARAAARDAVVLRGGASDAEGMPPYLPFLEALGQYVRSGDVATLREQAGAAAATLDMILPELGSRLGDLPARYSLAPEQARLRLYEAVGAFLAAIAARSTLVLLLDDLHWADTASLDLLSYIAGHQPAARLLILGAYRVGEIAKHAGFARMLTELTRLRRLTTVAIEPLGLAAIADLAAAYLGAPIEPHASRLLHRHSEGNPFFAEELLRGWIETGDLARAGASWALLGPGERGVPESILAAVRQRLSRLAPEVIEILRTAAIIGRTFDPTFLAEVAGQDLEQVEEWLRDAGHAHLIQSIQDEAWNFGHDKIRESLYADVTATRRRRLHGFIGRALEARLEPIDARQLADLAFHFTRSGDRARGATYALRAAEQAMRTYAPEQAAAHYRAALDLLDAADPRRGDLLLGLGEAAVLAAAEQQAISAFETAQAWFVQAGQATSAARAALGAGRAAWRIEALAVAQPAFETALRLLEERSCAETVEALVDLGSLLAVSLHQQAAGIAYGQRALAMARRLEQPRLLAKASRTVGNLLVRANDLAAGLPLLEQALKLAADANDPSEAAECCACLVMAYSWNTDFARCQQLIDPWIEFIQRHQDPFQLRHIYSGMAMLHGLRGQWAAAEQKIALAQQVVDRLGSPEPVAFLQMMRGFLAHERGDDAAAEEHLTAATASFRALGPNTLVWYLGLLGVAQAAQGKRQQALECAGEVEALIATVPAGTMPTGEPLAHLATIALALGDHERIARYQPRLAAFRGQYHDVLIDRLLGQIAIAARDWSSARSYLAAAEATARREQMPSELARTLATQAELAHAASGRSGIAQAHGLLDQAIRQFADLGNTSEERRLRERLIELTRPTVRVQRPQLPAGLSEREVEVLRLVVAGKSNRQIAQELSLSEKTVANHLTNIFLKTGADNRAGAVAFAIRHGLA